MSRLILVATTLAMMLAGCDRFPDNGIQVVSNLPPDENCLLSADQEIRLLGGTYDIAYRNSNNEASDYLIAPLVRSYLVDTALEFQAVQNNIQITDFDVTLHLADGRIAALPPPLVNPYRVRTTAVIPAAADSGQFNDEVAAAVGIPASYQAALQEIRDATGFSTFLLDIRANGTTFGGFSQQSAPYRFPVEICEGCLERCVAEDLDSSCLPGQDLSVYCTTVLPPTP